MVFVINHSITAQVNDFDYCFSTSLFIKYTVTGDSVNTKIDTSLTLNGLRYFNKMGSTFAVHNPKVSIEPTVYNVQYIGWDLVNNKILLNYNILNEYGQVRGSIYVDVFTPCVSVYIQNIQINYQNYAPAKQ